MNQFDELYESLMNEGKVKISSSKVYKELYKTAIDFYANLLFPNEYNSLTLDVKIKKRLPSKEAGSFGYVQPRFNNPKLFTVTIEEAFSSLMMSRIAHEMVHVKQFVKGELIITKEGEAIWKGKNLGQWDAIEYRERPWEKEAYAKQQGLRDKFVEAHKDYQIQGVNIF